MKECKLGLHYGGKAVVVIIQTEETGDEKIDTEFLNTVTSDILGGHVLNFIKPKLPKFLTDEK